MAVENIEKFNGKCKISTWLCQIAKYIWYGKIKKEKKSKEISIEELKNEQMVQDCVSTIEDSICDKESKIEILKAMQKLDDETKNVMYLRLLGNLNYEEIAGVMGKSANWARVTFFRGKNKIKEENNGEGM